MDKGKIIEVIKDPSVKSNKDLSECLQVLSDEFEKTKESVLSLTRHMDVLENSYNKINEEINNRIVK